MKRLLVFVALTATVAAAPGLRSPAEVAAEWKLFANDRPPSLVPPRLADAVRSAAPAPLAMLARDATAPVPPTSRQYGRWPGALYDAPSRHRVRRLPPEIPEDAIPWLYRDQTYWLVPLGG